MDRWLGGYTTTHIMGQGSGVWGANARGVHICTIMGDWGWYGCDVNMTLRGVSV